MPALALCFHVHQPYRLRRFSFFEGESSREYFDDALNREIVLRVAERCYEQTNAILATALKTYGDDFSCAFSITGTAVEQLRCHAPKALESFSTLARFPSVEFVAETYYHSLVSLAADENEFKEQVQEHIKLLEHEFGRVPNVFRNTELIFNDRVAAMVEKLGFSGALVEGVGPAFSSRDSRAVYGVSNTKIAVLPRDCAASDDIAFRFNNRETPGSIRTAREYIDTLAARSNPDDVVLVYVDYETFGEHHGQESGILRFLAELPEAVLRTPGWRFITPSQALQQGTIRGEISFPTTSSWADTEKDESAWLGNSMQKRAFEELYRSNLRELISREEWSKLQTSDHLYYMSTKGAADGDVHQHFSPFDSPYDAFIAFMNVARAVRKR